jgi:hypothetical protein
MVAYKEFNKMVGCRIHEADLETRQFLELMQSGGVKVEVEVEAEAETDASAEDLRLLRALDSGLHANPNQFCTIPIASQMHTISALQPREIIFRDKVVFKFIVEKARATSSSVS